MCPRTTDSKSTKLAVWTPDEDDKLRELVQKYGSNNRWRDIAHRMKTKNNRQCRDRWKFVLNPEINREPFSQYEDEMLIDLINQYGTHWIKIKDHFVNRNTLQLKNRWRCLKINKRNKDVQKLVAKVGSMQIQQQFSPIIPEPEILSDSYSEIHSDSQLEQEPQPQYESEPVQESYSDQLVRESYLEHEDEYNDFDQVFEF